VKSNRALLWILAGIAGLAMLGTGAVIMLTDWKKKAGPYLAIINAAEDRHGIPRDLLVRQAYQESHFRDDIISGAVRSPAGATGIMQLIPRFYPGVNPLDVGQAVEAAAASMAGYFRQYGSWGKALAAYNDGPGNLNRILAGQKDMPIETKNYVAQILGDRNDAYPGSEVA
jgi:soluble lytic murein transglycosylase-like protein